MCASTMSSTSSNIPKRAANKKDQRLEKVGKCRHASLIFNILAGLCGFGSIGIGVWNIVDKTVGVYVGVTQAPSDHNLSYYCYGLCFLGFVAFIGFIFGCCALCKLNTCCLKVHYVFAAVTGLLVLCPVAVIHLYQESLQGIPLLTLVSDKVEIYLERFLNTSLVNNYLEGTNTMVSWNRLQIEQNCCGVRGIEDYKNSAWKNNSSPLSKMIFPNSCCVVQEKDYVNPKPTNQLMCQLKTSGFYHQTGCLEVIMAWYKQSSTISLLILGGLLLFEAICFTLATNISRIIGNDQP